MQDCLFCKIIAGEIPNYTVYQDDYVLAFLDIHPCSQGHTVVIPKKHFSSILEMNKEEWEKVMNGLQLTAARVQEKIQPEGMNIGINERLAAGQAVPHAHWHILPRWKGDGGGSMHSIVKSKDTGEVERIAGLFKQAL